MCVLTSQGKQFDVRVNAVGAHIRLQCLCHDRRRLERVDPDVLRLGRGEQREQADVGSDVHHHVTVVYPDAVAQIPGTGDDLVEQLTGLVGVHLRDRRAVGKLAGQLVVRGCTAWRLLE